MKLIAALCAVLLTASLLVACGQQQRQERPRQADEPRSGTTSQASVAGGPETTGDREEDTASGDAATVETTTGAQREDPREPPAEGPPFTAAPEDAGGEPGAAQSIGEVRFGVHEGYERLVVEFESGGGPTSGVPEWRFESPTGEGYGRIVFPGLESTAVSGGKLGGSIMDDFYVVRAPDGGFFVDLFATGAFQYRILELGDPGRFAIDYRPSTSQLGFPLPVRGERNVVMEPRAGEAVGSPLTVSGYSRNPEASTTVILEGPGGEVLAETTVQANDWTETWGYFEASLDVPAFQGQATLRVGSESARDGTFEGVEVPVVYGG